MRAIQRIESDRATEALTIARTAQGEAKGVANLLKRLQAR